MSEYNPVVPINVGGDTNNVDITVKKQGTIPANVQTVKRIPMQVASKKIDIDVGVNNTGMVGIDISGGGHLPADDYNALKNKPSLNGVVLHHNKDFDDVGLHTLSTMEILHILT